ncbi:MAG: IS1595 family transposase, partial [Litorivicinus sp.]
DACGHSVYMLKSRPEASECRLCRHQFSLRSGTPLHGSHLSLRLWLVALYMIATASKGISARQLGRWLGVPYKTAWHLNHRIRSMMLTVPHRGEPLSGEVEIDEQYGGGAQRARNNPSATPEYVQPKSPTGRGQYRPLLLTMAQRGGAVVAQKIDSHSKHAIQEAVEQAISPDAVVMTDGLPAYCWIGERQPHHWVIHSKKQFARREAGRSIHVNTCESFHRLFQRTVQGVYHFVSGKHVDRYLGQSRWYWLRKKAGPISRMADLFAGAPPLPYRDLVHG